MTHLAAVETGSRLWSRSVTWSHVPLSHHGTLRLWEPSEGKLRLPAHHWVKRIEHWLWAIRRSLKACLLLLFFLLIFLRLLLALIFLFEGLGQIFICQISCKHKKCVGYRSFCKLWLLSLSYTFHIESHVCCHSPASLCGHCEDEDPISHGLVHCHDLCFPFCDHFVCHFSRISFPEFPNSLHQIHYWWVARIKERQLLEKTNFLFNLSKYFLHFSSRYFLSLLSSFGARRIRSATPVYRQLY